MSYSLLIVDMQKYFNAACDPLTISNCQEEIKKAIKNRAAIIFLEYAGCGKTAPELLNLIQKYDRVYVKTKKDDDGSFEAMSIINNYRLAKSTIRVCGVNTDCCVLSTVVGLHALLPNAKIEVIEKACNSDWQHEVGIDKLHRLKNVKILHKILKLN